jgi:hypothetical protein
MPEKLSQKYCAFCKEQPTANSEHNYFIAGVCSLTLQKKAASTFETASVHLVFYSYVDLKYYSLFTTNRSLNCLPSVIIVTK